MKRLALAIGILFATTALCIAAEQSAPEQGQAPSINADEGHASSGSSPSKADTERASYAIGMSMAKEMKSQGIELDPDAMVRGYKDVASGGKPGMTDDEAQSAIMAFRMEVALRQQEELKKAGEENKKKGDAFLAAHKKKQGVHTTSSGLQYRVIREGQGKKPGPNDAVKVNYRATFIDGTEFDSSSKQNQPAEIQVTDVIPGCAEALQLMKTGSKYEFVVPPDLAFGETGARGVIPPNATLVFEIELVSVERSKAAAKPS
jgi:FKBP-type peptidyl-prolyl cis-trans isomerase FklB